MEIQSGASKVSLILIIDFFQRDKSISCTTPRVSAVCIFTETNCKMIPIINKFTYTKRIQEEYGRLEDEGIPLDVFEHVARRIHLLSFRVYALEHQLPQRTEEY